MPRKGGIEDDMDEETLLPEIFAESQNEKEEEEVLEFIKEKCPTSDVFERRMEDSDKSRSSGNDAFRENDVLTFFIKHKILISNSFCSN